jgi:hypothetical protein
MSHIKYYSFIFLSMQAALPIHVEVMEEWGKMTEKEKELDYHYTSQVRTKAMQDKCLKSNTCYM